MFAARRRRRQHQRRRGPLPAPRLTHQWRVSTCPSAPRTSCTSSGRGCSGPGGLTLGDVAGVCLASVVPALTGGYGAGDAAHRVPAGDRLHPDLSLGSRWHRQSPGGRRRPDHERPAARERYGAPAVVADFGISTNFDVVSAGTFIGGDRAGDGRLGGGACLAHGAIVPHRAAPPAAGHRAHHLVHAVRGLLWLRGAGGGDHRPHLGEAGGAGAGDRHGGPGHGDRARDGPHPAGRSGPHPGGDQAGVGNGTSPGGQGDPPPPLRPPPWSGS